MIALAPVLNDREALEHMVGELLKMLAQVLDQEFGPKTVGCCLLLFDFGEGGNLAYAANASRADMIRTLDEFRAKLRETRPQG